METKELLTKLLLNYEEIMKQTTFPDREYTGSMDLIDTHNDLINQILNGSSS